MPTYSADWTEDQTFHGSGTLNAASSTEDNIDVDAGGYYELACSIDIDIASGTPSGPITVELFRSVDDGSLFDTEPFAKFVAIQYTGTNGRKRASFAVPRCPRVKVKVTNGTAVNGTYIGKYSGLKQAS